MSTRSSLIRAKLRLLGQDLHKRLETNLHQCTEHTNAIYCNLVGAVLASQQSATTSGEVQPFQEYHMPRLSPGYFLQLLSLNGRCNIPSRWKRAILQYGVALTALQQAERFVNLREHPADLIKELENPGHTNLDPAVYPESLLIEVENGLMIRPVQGKIAEKMINPPKGENAMMQLTMGEGKSFVIVPVVATAVANGARLGRVVVAKPQFQQALEILMSKLGGWCNRRIYHMPFSRSLKLTEGEVRLVAETCRECMHNGGVLLVQPEHILSFSAHGLRRLLLPGARRSGNVIGYTTFVR